MPEKDIEAFFDEFILKKMREDIKSGIKQGANYLTVIYLAAYTEYLGSIKLNSFNKKGQMHLNYKSFLYDLNKEYVKIDKKIRSNKKDSLFRRIWCELFNEYFIKEKIQIKSNSKYYQGIYYNEKEDIIIISINDYLNELIEALDKLKNTKKVNPSPRLKKMVKYWRIGNKSKNIQFIKIP